MKITIKIKLDSGKEIELTDEEYKELQAKMGKIVKEPYFIPYVPDPWPNYPRYDWLKVICSDNTVING